VQNVFGYFAKLKLLALCFLLKFYIFNLKISKYLRKLFVCFIEQVFTDL